MTTRRILIALYLIILLTPGVTWLKNRAWEGGPAAYGLMRLAGMYAFTLITLQLGLGAMMDLWRPIFGGARVLKLHIRQGVAGFVLAWMHPVFYILAAGWGAVINTTGYENWGKAGLLLLTAGVAGGALRTTSILARHWRWVHRSNYLALALIYRHSWELGSDVHTWPMAGMYYLAPAVLAAAIYTKLRQWYITKYGDRRHDQGTGGYDQTAPAGDGYAKKPGRPGYYRG